MKIHSSILRKLWQRSQTKAIVLLLSIYKYRDKSSEKTEFDKKEINRILFVRLDRIGDILLCTPAIRMLRENFPHAHITVLGNKYNKRAVENNKDIDEILCIEDLKSSLFNFSKTENIIKKMRFDLAVDSYYDFSVKSALLVYLSRAKYRIGYKSRYSDIFFNLSFKGKTDIYEAKRHIDLLKELGLKPSSHKLIFKAKNTDLRKMETYLRENNYYGSSMIIGINPGSRRKTHRWDARKYSMLADELVKQYNAKIIVTWGLKEKKIAEKVLKNMNEKALLAPSTNLKELSALMSFMRLFISSDTGAFHIAVASSIPVLAIFGKGDVSRWAPVEKSSIYIVKGKSVKNTKVSEVMLKVKEVLQ